MTLTKETIPPSGYSAGPVNTHPNQQGDNRMFKSKATALVAAAFAALGLTACVPQEIEGKPTPTTPPSLVDAGIEGGWLTTEAPAPMPVVDPYSSDGTWLVPAEIAPGTYRAQGTRGSSADPSERTGYYAVCADFACDIDMDGSDYTGMISNDFFTGSSIVTIPAHAVSIELSDVTLTRMG